MKIKELTPNKRYNVFFMVKNIEERLTKTNNPYLLINLSDGEDAINAKLWDKAIKDFPFNKGDLIYTQIEVSIYQDKNDYTIKQYRAVKDEDNVNKADFIRCAPIPAEQIYNELIGMCDLYITDSRIKELVKTIYNDHKKELLTHGGAKYFHHNYIGGLLYHVYRMATTANAITISYPKADKGTIIASILLHDIGKLYEFETDKLGNSEYTLSGSLFGHHVMAYQMVTDYARKLDIPANDPILMHILHIIISHHGKKEWGSPVEPMTLEATIVHYLDMMDTKINIIEDSEPETNTISTGRVKGVDNYLYSPVRMPETMPEPEHTENIETEEFAEDKIEETIDNIDNVFEELPFAN